MSQYAIEVNHISKKFVLRKVNYGFKDLLLHSAAHVKEMLRPDYFCALNDVSFTIKSGESVGICGPNGCGKTTLLECIAGILSPDCGSIRHQGRIGMLLDVGVGFCNELSGRDNIIINGVLQGMSRKEVRQKEDEIIDFSGIKDFIDQPLFTYSAGMAARLGFAIATAMEPEILLIDEILAVGDADFREKSLTRIRALLQKQGTTLLLVSHNMNDINEFCNRRISMEHGHIIEDRILTCQ